MTTPRTSTSTSDSVANNMSTSATAATETGAPNMADPWGRASSRALHPSAHSGDEPLVGVIAAGLAAVSVPWELSSGTAPTERSYELLLSTEQYDAWLIHWPTGTGLDAHDHGGSIGAFAVVSGVLDEDIHVDGVDHTRRLRAGESVTFAGDHVHAVVNRGETGATSVHVYSPPLRSMSFYSGSPATGRTVDRVQEFVGRDAVTE